MSQLLLLLFCTQPAIVRPGALNSSPFTLAHTFSVVDPEAVQELAAYCGVAPVIVPGLAHDVMLDARWREAAEAIKAWADEL